jgi:hypothetical protein
VYSYACTGNVEESATNFSMENICSQLLFCCLSIQWHKQQPLKLRNVGSFGKFVTNLLLTHREIHRSPFSEIFRRHTVSKKSLTEFVTHTESFSCVGFYTSGLLK